MTNIELLLENRIHLNKTTATAIVKTQQNLYLIMSLPMAFRTHQAQQQEKAFGGDLSKVEMMESVSVGGKNDV